MMYIFKKKKVNEELLFAAELYGETTNNCTCNSPCLGNVLCGDVGCVGDIGCGIQVALCMV